MSDERTRGVGRPKGYSPCGKVKSEAVKVYLDEGEAERLSRLSRKTGESRSQIMRMGLALILSKSKRARKT